MQQLRPVLDEPELMYKPGLLRFGRNVCMPSIERELGEAARDLATAILDAGHLKGAQRTQAGAEIERQLKRFAEVVAKKIKEEDSGS